MFLFIILFPVLFDKFLHLSWMVRNALASEESAAVAGDEKVVLKANAAKVLVGLEHVKV